MLTLAMTAGNDNAIVWVLRINGDANIYKLATADITLSNNAWDGQVLGINTARFSIPQFGKSIGFESGGDSRAG